MKMFDVKRNIFSGYIKIIYSDSNNTDDDETTFDCKYIMLIEIQLIRNIH